MTLFYKIVFLINFNLENKFHMIEVSEICIRKEKRMTSIFDFTETEYYLISYRINLENEELSEN